MVGGESPFLGELPASFKLVSPASTLSFVTFPILWSCAGSMTAAVGSVPSPAQQNPCSSVHPQLISTFCVPQGRLLQTKKSGYFPSSSVKPCPVDARVCAKPGAPAGAAVGWQGNFCSTLGGKRCPNKAFGSPQPIPVGFWSQFLPCSEPMVPPQEPHISCSAGEQTRAMFSSAVRHFQIKKKAQTTKNAACSSWREALGYNTALTVTRSALFAASQQPAAIPGD